MARKFKVGIVGTGGIARNDHIPGWQTIPDVEIVAVCDIDKARAATAGQQAGTTAVFTDYKKLMQRKEIDAVDICTPNLSHTPIVLAALAAGKHVICEKPLAVTTKEVKAMGQMARTKRRILMTAQHRRYESASVAATGSRPNGARGISKSVTCSSARNFLRASWCSGTTVSEPSAATSGRRWCGMGGLMRCSAIARQ